MTAKRIDDLKAVMRKKNVDIAVIGPTTNMRYLLGNTPHPDERLCVLLVSHDKTQLIVPALNEAQARSFTDVPLVLWEDHKGPDGAIRSSILKEHGGVAAVDGSMRADFLLSILKEMSFERIVAADEIVGELRMRKSKEEIAALKDAAALADRAMVHASVRCVPGMKESDLAWEIESFFRKNGAEQAMFTIVAAGENAAVPHYNHGDAVIEEGKAVVIDIGASLNGYQSDITRVVCPGKPQDEYRTVYEIVRSANAKGREAVRPGATCGEVDAACRSVIEAAGYGERFIHRTGHGIGLDVHEPPYITAGSDLLLEPGMTFSVEPGIYIPGRFGVRIEDIVAVTDKGCDTLTGSGHDLIVTGV
ncbi:MAG: aminopeptidase P family protein [Spirochaetes bacterium]|nr:aminopeptidase P family protein [Spirochaetota bacterium]